MTFLNAVLPFLLAPLLLGVINRTKAVFAGRRGAPILQPYFDVWKLLRKGAVYSRTTSWVFRAGPVAGFAATAAACLILPLGGSSAPIAFNGDLILLAYLLGIARFFTVIAALDTGSSFEGMGASREVQFSALAEPALLLGLGVLAKISGHLSASAIYASVSTELWRAHLPALFLTAIAFGIVYLSENARIPVDDPNTHLELTMIHEVMVLDHSGPEFGFIQYAAALKLWLLGSLVVGILLPLDGSPWNILGFPAALMALAVLTGVVESVMPRLRLLAVPKLLVGATAISGLALVLAVT